MRSRDNLGPSVTGGRQHNLGWSRGPATETCNGDTVGGASSRPRPARIQHPVTTLQMETLNRTLIGPTIVLLKFHRSMMS